ncbi:MAG: putative replicase protein [Boaesivirus pseudofaecivicinum]|uniref:RNA-directed RNA polymerase n=1 Tax=Leviviridae sp. TaxID=2027243 RepID=A0ABY3SS90_9VIRU|nr:MAG: putative replicase protein [Leviviridae sp.]
MKNSHEWYVQGLFDGILADVVKSYPSCRMDVEKDKLRLHGYVATRGLSVFTLDLPAYGKHFDKCLSSGRLTRFAGPLMRPFSSRTVVPRLFKGLLLNVFDVDGTLRTDADVLSIKFLRQLYNGAKKLRIECASSRTFSAVHEFISIDHGLRPPTLPWVEDDLNVGAAKSLHFGDAQPPYDPSDPMLFPEDRTAPTVPYALIDKFQLSADIVASMLGGFDPTEWRPKHGPGAVSDSKRYKSKYDFPHWPDKLDSRFPLSILAFANEGIWADSVATGRIAHAFSKHEPPSKLIAVPKSQKTPRLIASEPTAHMWCQQSLKHFLWKRKDSTPLKSVIHFTDQSENQQAARHASITSSHWTMDLSSASDRLSCWVVERFFRMNPSVLDALHTSRTRWLVNDIDKKQPRYIVLRKFAPMGSAVTFPVQSIIYSTIVLAAMCYIRALRPSIEQFDRLAQEVRVFGDDLVVPSDCGAAVRQLLEYLEFKVNLDKTHSEGNFRESCGVDVFRGHDVTPAYVLELPVKARPESLISSVETARNFFFKGYKSASQWIESTTRKHLQMELPFVPKDSGAFGWPTDLGVINFHLRRRFNKNTHTVEYLTLVPVGKRKLGDQPGESSLLQYFTEKPAPSDAWKAGVGLKPRLLLQPRWVSDHYFYPEKIT